MLCAPHQWPRCCRGFDAVGSATLSQRMGCVLQSCKKDNCGLADVDPSVGCFAGLGRSCDGWLVVLLSGIQSLLSIGIGELRVSKA